MTVIKVNEAGPEYVVLPDAPLGGPGVSMEHERVLDSLAANTGQDRATIRDYLNRRAAASPLASLDVWIDSGIQIMQALRDGKSIDWGA